MGCEVNVSEALDPVKQRSLSFYLVALFVVAPLRLVAPLSWIFVVYSLHTGSIWSFTWRGHIFFAFALSEVFFSVYHHHLVTLVSVPWKHKSGNIAQLQLAFTRVLKSGLAVLPEEGYDEESLDFDRPGSPAEPITQLTSTDPRGIEFRNVLRTWFGRVPWSSIRQTTGNPNSDGSNPAAAPIRMTLDKVHVYGRPFFYYALIFAVNWYLRTWYTKHWNLRHGDYKGLLQYYPVTRDLRLKFPDRPLLIPLQPHISQDIFHPRFLDPILTMVSHSNGSYLHAWCLKQHPEIISRSCFVDPVTFCSWEGDACYNFLYRLPTTGFDLVVSFFVGCELGVANLLRRHFDWSSNALWYEEIPNGRNPSKTFFLLGGRDDIINAERVKKYLSSHGVRKGIWFDPDGLHGDALKPGGAGHARVMQWLRETNTI
ncbi:hypothetical protein K438DRAFT_1826557 [Mycena galopus ATCC 62051]|nr:hypothetical protein K438DRAFT_1826557 [Mycena galopus ATCC 62051]